MLSRQRVWMLGVLLSTGMIVPVPAAEANSPAAALSGLMVNTPVMTQQTLMRRGSYSPRSRMPEETDPNQDVIIFTDRQRNPISQREFSELIRNRFIEPPPPEDASFDTY